MITSRCSVRCAATLLVFAAQCGCVDPQPEGPQPAVPIRPPGNTPARNQRPLPPEDKVRVLVSQPRLWLLVEGTHAGADVWVARARDGADPTAGRGRLDAAGVKRLLGVFDGLKWESASVESPRQPRIEIERAGARRIFTSRCGEDCPSDAVVSALGAELESVVLTPIEGTTRLVLPPPPALDG